MSVDKDKGLLNLVDEFTVYLSLTSGSDILNLAFQVRECDCVCDCVCAP